MADNQPNAEEGAATDPKEGEGEGGQDPKEPEILPADDYEPEVRRKPWSSREERAEFFKNKKGEERAKPEEEGGDEGEDQPLTRAELKKLLAERDGTLTESLKTFAEGQAEALTETELKTFLENPLNAHLKKYGARAEKTLKAHPTLTVRDAFKILDYDEAEKRGADKKEQADEDAKKNSVRGTTKRQSGKPDFKSMSPRELLGS